MTAKYLTETLTREEIHAGDYPIATDTGTAGGAIEQYAPVGRVTTGGKIITSVSTATDGSETPIGFAAFAAAADNDSITWFTSGGYDEEFIVKGAWTTAELEAAFDRTPIKIITTQPL